MSGVRYLIGIMVLCLCMLTTSQPTSPEPIVVPEPEPVPEVVTELYELTAYCPCSKCCGKWANGITSTGTTATQGRTIAVDPKVIPYGTKVLIGENEYIAEDCGGAIKGKRIDVYFDSHADALKFGRQVREIQIIGGFTNE